MHTVTGIFASASASTRGLDELHRAGFDREHVNLLVPGSPRESIPTETAEQPGLGGAIGGVAGGAAGAAWGVQLLTAAAAGMVPGVGPVLAVGTVAALLAGIGGAVAGQAIENTLTRGLPKDELKVYENALRDGRAVVIVLTDDAEQAEKARAALATAGAEGIDVAREQWWVGLRERMEPAGHAPPQPRGDSQR